MGGRWAKPERAQIDFFCLDSCFNNSGDISGDDSLPGTDWGMMGKDTDRCT